MESKKLVVGKRIEDPSQLSCSLISHSAASRAITLDKLIRDTGSRRTGANLGARRSVLN